MEAGDGRKRRRTGSCLPADIARNPPLSQAGAGAEGEGRKTGGGVGDVGLGGRGSSGYISGH
jgi:hypothetical protein